MREMEDDAPPPGEAEASEAERAEAEALRRMLDGEGGDEAKAQPAEDDRIAIGLIRAASGKEPPLGALRGRGIAREAIATAIKQGERRQAGFRRRVLIAGALAAALVLAIGARATIGRPAPLPERLCSRSAGMLVPGPFPASQTAAARLDVVLDDRLVAFRELRLGGGGPRTK